jgi:DNA-binding IclR family transcriptional regulator
VASALCVDLRKRANVSSDSEPAGKSRRGPAAVTSGRPDGDDAFVVRALSKGLLILGLFDAEHRDWTLDEMVAQIGLPRMTAYRMARTLQGAGYLVHDPVTSKYHLGPALLATTYLSESYAQLAEMARPYLESLVEQTGESATLAVEVDGVAVCADMVISARPSRRDVAVGRIIGDTANAHGKMIAASKPDSERERIVNLPHPQLTPNTITDPHALLAELEKTWLEGVSFDREERNLGTCAVAAPVLDQMGEVVATLAVIVPTGRFGPAESKACADVVKTTAASLSAYLGHAGAGRSYA